jgi:hypothetical protein
MMGRSSAMDPFRHLLAFINFLRVKRIRFTIMQSRDDAIMLAFATFGARYELEFLDDGPVYSIFRGSEAVADDYPALIQMIENETR